MFLSIDFLFLSIDVWYGTVLHIGVIVLLSVLAINETTIQQNHTYPPKLSKRIMSSSTPREWRRSSTVFAIIGGPQR